MMNNQNHTTNNTKQFFDQWHVYDQIIHNDYMGHQGIHNALQLALNSLYKNPFTILDLGCGDGSQIAQTLKGLSVKKYIGIDLSPVALEKARSNFSKVQYEVFLLEANFTKYLKNSSTPHVDVMIAGFSVHHLREQEKSSFFHSCFSKLNKGGDLFFYDIFRRTGESREQYIKEYCQNCDQTWTQLSSSALNNTKKHVQTCDFPETYQTLAQIAKDTGFTVPSKPIYTDGEEFHRLYHFRK